MKQEFYLKNKSIPMSTLGVAGLFLVFRLALLIFGEYTFEHYSAFDYVVTVLTILIVLIEVYDLYRMSKNQLKVVADTEFVQTISFFFTNKKVYYKDIEDATLREKDIEILLKNGKKSYISGPTTSDLIRLMKILKDKSEK